jgi:hypothetical protein
VIAVITILGLIAAVYGISVVLVWLGPGDEAHPVYQRYDPARHEFPRDVSAWLEANATALSREGFAVAGDLFRLGPSTTQRVLLITNDATEERGVVAAVVGSTGNVGMFVEFAAELPDGRSLDVSNADGPRLFAPIPGRATERFRSVRDPARLLRIFRVLVRRQWGSAALAHPEVKADPAGYLSADTFRQMSRQVEAGYFRLNRARQTFQRTLKGAVLMTWKLLPPFRPLLVARQERRAATLLREIGLDGLDQRPIAPVTLTDASTVQTDDPTVALLREAAGQTPRPPRPRARKAVFVLMALLALNVVLIGVRRRLRSPRPEYHLPAGFTVPADFDGAVATLERLAGVPSRALMGVDRNGDPVATGGVIVVVTAVRAGGLLQAAHDQFRQRGFLLFRFDRYFGRDTVPVRVGLVPTADPYDLLARLGTGGRRDRRTPDEVIAWLRALAPDEPFELTGAGVDWFRARFVGKPHDPHALAQRIYEFCPRAVDEDLEGNVERLAGLLARGGQLMCEWR